jgi:hypothetical protein
MNLKNVLFSLAFLLFVTNTFADSPLTSTPFYLGYMDIPLIRKADKSNGIITEEQLHFLTEKHKPIAVKLALINSLRSKFEGKSNAPAYIKFLFERKPQLNYKNFINKASSEELICYAYLKALDNYFDVKSATIFAKQAMRKAPTSYSIHLIGTLISVQVYLSQRESYKIYTTMNQVRSNTKLKIDLRKKSIKAIFDYIESYKESFK